MAIALETSSKNKKQFHDSFGDYIQKNSLPATVNELPLHLRLTLLLFL
jgi:hypothetical protein